MRNEDKKGKVELSVFREFANKVDIPLLSETATKRPPPEPDILCEHQDEGYIAFELVEICDATCARDITQTGKSGASGGAFRTDDPSALIVWQKLNKSYDTQHPIELLCYLGRTVSWDEYVIARIRPLIEAADNIPYRRIWLLGDDEVSLVWENDQ